MSLRPAKATSYSSPSPCCYSREVRGAKQMYEKHKSRQRTLDAPLAGSCVHKRVKTCYAKQVPPTPFLSCSQNRTETAHVALASTDPVFVFPYHALLTPWKPCIEQESPSYKGDIPNPTILVCSEGEQPLVSSEKGQPWTRGDSSLPPTSQCQEMLFSMANDNPQKTSTRVQKTSLKWTMNQRQHKLIPCTLVTVLIWR